MTAELITQKDLGIMLSMGPKKAREFCASHGLHPINVGMGKVARLRWPRAEVMQLIGTLQTKGKPQDYVKKSRRSTVGKSLKQLMSELQTPIQ